MFRYNDIIIRVIEDSDLFELRKLRNDPVTWINLSRITFLTDHMQMKWYESLTERKDKQYLIASTDEVDILGVVRMDEIDQINRSIRIGCDIVPKYRAQGNGSKVLNCILKYCFHFLNMHRVWLVVAEYNEIGIHLYSKLGFKKEGRYRDAIYRNGKFNHCLIMSMLETEYKYGI
jgi:RimJ/RimL family protein N-acetyltransferase